MAITKWLWPSRRNPLAENAAYVGRRPSVLYYLGRAHFGLGHFRDAIVLFERLVAAEPELARATIEARL